MVCWPWGPATLTGGGAALHGVLALGASHADGRQDGTAGIKELAAAAASSAAAAWETEIYADLDAVIKTEQVHCQI